MPLISDRSNLKRAAPSGLPRTVDGGGGVETDPLKQTQQNALPPPA